MAKKVTDIGIQADKLLTELPLIELEKKDMANSIKDTPLESQLLSLAEVSIDRETELLRQLLIRLGKLEN